jgi:hypothetical protein
MKEKAIELWREEKHNVVIIFLKRNIENIPISDAHNISSRRLRWNVVQFFNNCIHMGPILDIFHYKREERERERERRIRNKISIVLHMNCKRYTSTNKIDYTAYLHSYDICMVYY